MERDSNFEPQRNMQFCFYYKGERENPFHSHASDAENDAGFAWMSEMFASRTHGDNVERFLNFIISHMGKWDPYSYGERFNRYLLTNTKIPLDDRIAYVKKFSKSNNPVPQQLEAQR